MENATKRLPVSILSGVAVWGLLLVVYVINQGWASVVSIVIAAIIMSGSFTLIGWYSQKPGVIPEGAWLRRTMASHTSWAHVLYTGMIFLFAGLLGGGSVFGAEFTNAQFGFLIVPIVGLVFGFVMCLGLELDIGIMEVGLVDRGLWSLGFSLVLTFCVWSILFAVFSAAGGAVFIITVILTRILFSTMIYRIAPGLLDTQGWETIGDHFLALSLMVLPLVAYLSGVF